MSKAFALPRPVRVVIVLVGSLALLAGIAFGARALIGGLQAGNRIPTVSRLSDIRASMDIRPFGGNLIARDGGSLACYTPDNVKLWALNLDPAARFTADNGHVAIWNGKQFAVYDQNGNEQYAPQETLGEISLARCGANATAIVVGDKDREIQVYSKEAKVIDRRALVKLAAIDMQFFTDDLLWYSTLDTGSTKPHSAVQVIQPSRSKSMGNRASDDEILYRMIFNPHRNEFIAVGTHTISYYDQTMLANDKRPDQQVYGWQLVDARPMKNHTCMVFAPSAQSAEGVAISDMRVYLGDAYQDVRLPNGCLAVFCGDQAIYGVSSQEIYIYPYPKPGKPLDTRPRVVSTQGAQLTSAHALLEGDRLVVGIGDQVVVLNMGGT